MNQLKVFNGQLIDCEDGRVTRKDIIIDAGTIKELVPPDQATSSAETELDVEGLYVSPGFIDLQVNGGSGADFLHSTPGEINDFSTHWLSTGTTSFLGTIITNPIDTMRKGMSQLLEANPPNLLGFHLEGPFISREKRGTHNPEYIRKPDRDSLTKLVEGYEQEIQLVTIAPELPEVTELFPVLDSINSQISLGHTNGTYSEVSKGVHKGATSFTHLFNGMTGFHHREPGAVGVGLHSSCFAGLIADGLHVHPVGINLAYRLKGSDELYLVTDAIVAAGLEEGSYNFGEQSIEVKNGIARLENGTIAGSTLTMNKAVKHFQNYTNSNLVNAVKSATLTPARVINCDDHKGKLRRGYDADLIVFDDQIDIKYTIINGEVVYQE